jgi:hypothetical protein
MHGVAPQMCRSSSPSIVRRRSRRSLPRLRLKLNDFWQFYPTQVAVLCVAKRLRALRFCVQEETVTSWYDWRMAVVWLTAIGVASMIYFLPALRLVE